MFEVGALLDPVEEVGHAGREEVGDHRVDVAGEIEVREHLPQAGDRLVEFGRDVLGYGEREAVLDAVSDRLLEKRREFALGDPDLAVDQSAVDQAPLVAPLVGGQFQVGADADPVCRPLRANRVGQIELREEVLAGEALGGGAFELRLVVEFRREPLAGGVGLGASVLPGTDRLLDH